MLADDIVHVYLFSFHYWEQHTGILSFRRTIYRYVAIGVMRRTTPQ